MSWYERENRNVFVEITRSSAMNGSVCYSCQFEGDAQPMKADEHRRDVLGTPYTTQWHSVQTEDAGSVKWADHTARCYSSLSEAEQAR